MRMLLAALLIVALGGCASTASTSGPARRSLNVDDVVVYNSETELPDEYVLVEVLPPAPAPRYGRAVDPMLYARQRAASLGANMLLAVEANREIADGRIRASTGQGGSSSRLSSYNRLTFYALSTVADENGVFAAPPSPAADGPLEDSEYLRVRVYNAESELPEVYDVLGYVAPNESSYSPGLDPVSRARQRTHELGGNALLVLEVDAELGDAIIRRIRNSGGNFGRTRFVALRVPDSDAAVPSGQ